MAVSSYQLPSPRAVEPPLGEYTLAAKTSNPDAMYLGLQTQLGLAQHDYDSQVAAQHEFAIQQMMANQRDEQQKNAISILKEPGGGSFLASGNPLGMSLGGSPGAMTNLAQAGDTAQGAKNFQAAGTGLNQMSQGGYQLAPGSAPPPGLPAGMTTTNLGPALTQAAKIRAAAEVQAAGIRAAGGAGSGVSTGLVGTDPVYGTPVTGRASPKATPQQIDDWYRTHGGVRMDQPPPPLALPGPGGATSLQPNTTGLPPAQQDTDNSPLATVPAATAAATGKTSAPPPAATQQSNATAGTAALQQSVNANLGRMPAAVQTDIRGAAAKNGGQPVVGIDTDGKPYALGASGQKYK